MTDEYNNEKQKEIDDFFAQFDKISSDFNKSAPPRETTKPDGPEEPEISSATGTDAEDSADTKVFKTPVPEPPGIDRESAAVDLSFLDNSEEISKRRKTRMERLSEEKTRSHEKNPVAAKLSGAGMAVAGIAGKGLAFVKGKFLVKNSEEGDGDGNGRGQSAFGVMGTKAKRRKHKKYRINVKKLAKFIVCLGLICCLGLGAFVISVIAQAPDIDPDNIYSMLTEASILYDDEGNAIDSVFSTYGNRTNISYNDLPQNLVNAFVAIEDKTFWDHNGFNFIRIFGAIKDSILTGGNISGTSTITQQLARNVYLTEEKQIRTLKRKVAEAYYTVLLEKELSKEQILEAYVNTIFLGFNSDGIQTAAQSYFSKDVAELDLLECAALAALPKAPNAYALIKRVASEDVNAEDDRIIYRDDDWTYLYNGDKSKERRDHTLTQMCEQGMITVEERDAALGEELRDHMNPNTDALTNVSSYFADYVIEQVIEDLQEELNCDYEEARKRLYSGGLRIYTTMNQNAQKIAEEEFSNNANFPAVVNLKKDSAGNILNQNGNILLYKYSNLFDEDGTFRLTTDEYKAGEDGALILLKGHRLNIYKTTLSDGTVDYSAQFKSMYTIDENNTFYSIEGGALLIPAEYKDRDKDGNLIISGAFFKDKEYKDFFQFADGGVTVSSKNYTVKQKVVQPQGAMVITDYKTGGIKAMVGGRNTVGRLLFNRADSPRQPGSAIKPMAVYAPALQMGAEAAAGGSSQKWSAEDNLYGDYWTAASVIDDAPMTFQGKRWPKNWYPGFRGLNTLRTSVEQSINVNAVKVFQQVGVDYSIDFLKKLGVTTVKEDGDVNDQNAAALALGGMSNGVSPLQMAGGYGAIVNGGNYVEPIVYTKVTNKHGELLLEKIPREEQVMDAGVAFIMTDILHSTVTSGIANKAAIGSQPVGGKTGTTTDNFDAWFVGFTPQYAASVWIGNDVNIEMRDGSGTAARLWSKVMKQVCAGLPAGSFSGAPSNVVSVAIDTKSGMLPSELSSLDERGTVRSEYFIKGTQPKETDSVHTYVNACVESGYLATPYCPYSAAKFGVKRPYMPSSSAGDLDYEVPHYYCNLHNLDTAAYPISPGASVSDNFVWDGILRDPTKPNDSSPSGIDSSSGSGIIEGEGNIHYDPNDPTMNPGAPGGGGTTSPPDDTVDNDYNDTDDDYGEEPIWLRRTD